MKAYYIYKLTFPNGKVYIGQTSSFKLRMQDHRYMAVSNMGNRPIHKAIRKYGWDNIKRNVLIICGISQVDYYECSIIQIYKSNNIFFGYNLESGGNLNKKHAQSTKDLIRDKAIGRKTTTGKKVAQYDLNYNLINTWDAAKYADEFYCYTIGTVAKACRRSDNKKPCKRGCIIVRKPNKNATSSSYRWKYV